MRRLAAGSALTLAILLLAATSASAATTRADWVAQVDPICQNGQGQETALLQPVLAAQKRARKHHSRKLTKRADRAFRSFFAQYANVERAVNAQIATVPPAPDDVSLIQVWRRRREELLDLESRVLLGPFNPGKGVKGLGRLLSDFFELIGKQYEVADLVRDFGFHYCATEPAELQYIG
jgi:hypothetical protein